MQIRMACIGDAKGIAKVKVETWQDTYRGIITDDYLDAMSIEEDAERYQKRIGMESTYIMVLEEEGDIVGYASAGEARSETYRGWGEIYSLYILPSYQRRGGGASLLYYMADALKQLGHYKLVIWCLSGNPAQNFYLKMGGQPEVADMLPIGGEQYLQRAFVWHDVLKLLYKEELL